jgi:2-polyprenyl-3-methyl-5-hydroxy-6-metoxy-1,4-benzoquinol methylase
MSDNSSPPPARPVPDRRQIERLNKLWTVTAGIPRGTGPRARLAAAARKLVLPYLLRQEEFNAAVVDHLNHNIDAVEAWSQVNLQLDDMVDEMRRNREALLARERRSEASVAMVAATHQELRSAIGVLQQATQNLKREIERGRIEAGVGPDRVQSGAEGGARTRSDSTGPSSQLEALDSHKYVGFEDQFRGTSDDIRARVTEYLPVFEGTSDVVDIGCGRGEFLALMRDHGISARGIDLNQAMVEVCREQGLDATAADALAYLRAQPDQSLGGLFAAQVVEHLEPRYLAQLLDAAFDKLRPGAPIVLETINPACWFAFFESYIRDITHVRPLHPETLKYLLIASGFQQLEIRYRAPYPEQEKLQPIAAAAESTASPVTDWANTINANVEKINRLLFTWMDYAAIGRRS